MYTKQLTQWHPKGIASGVKQHLFVNSLHPFWTTTLQLAILGPRKNHSTPSIVQQ